MMAIFATELRLAILLLAVRKAYRLGAMMALSAMEWRPATRFKDAKLAHR
jgi:hypothetical protein